MEQIITNLKEIIVPTVSILVNVGGVLLVTTITMHFFGDEIEKFMMGDDK